MLKFVNRINFIGSDWRLLKRKSVFRFKKNGIFCMVANSSKLDGC